LNRDKSIPPTLATKLLHSFLRDDLAEEVSGDLEEKFYKTVNVRSVFKAKVNYWYQVINYIRPFAFKKSKSGNQNHAAMFKHNLLLSYRSFLRYKSSFLINLIGLSTGLTASLLIYMWVNDELHFDKFHEKDKQLYQVMERREIGGNVYLSNESTGILAEEMKIQLPEVEYAAAVIPSEWFQKFTLSLDEKNVKATGQYVGEDYLNIFSFPLIQGDRSTVLKDKNSIVITKTLALRLFGMTENIVGKTVVFQHEREFQITGILEDVPYRSSEQFEFLLSLEYYKDIQPWIKQWGNDGPHNFIVLKEGTNIAQFNAKIKNIVADHLENKFRFVFVSPFSYNYLHYSFDHGASMGARMEYVKLFSLIAVFILIIACINFMNLSTARAARRIKEIGIKKAIGAVRKQLIAQYLSESMLITFISAAVALLLVFLLLPGFNVLTGKQIAFELSRTLILAVTGIVVFTGLIAGSYPALYLSGFDPATVLKGKLTTSFGELWARKGLVVFQFTLSVVLIVAVVVVYNQIQYIQTKNLGYNRDHIIRFESEGKVLGTQETFIAALKQLPGVVNASGTLHTIVGRNFATNDFVWPGKNEKEIIFFEGMRGGYDLLPTLGMKIVSGRNFSRETSPSTIIINETAAKVMAMDDPIGKTIKLYGQDRQIIGVFKDFFFQSMHTTMQPMFYDIVAEENNPWYKILVKLEEGKERETIARIEEFYKSYNPGFILDYQYLDDAFQKMYASETRVGILSRYFAGIAILISCLGLFGLTAFTAERRQKEIGIRKVLGSSNWSIIYLLSGEFTKMVVMAIVIALPVSYLITSSWLGNFVYRIDLEWWFFLGAAVSALLIAWLTVGLQTFKASRVNPVNCLKSE